MSDKLAYSVREFAAASGLSRSTVYELVTSRKLPSIVLGAKRLIQPMRHGGSSTPPRKVNSNPLEERKTRPREGAAPHHTRGNGCNS